MISSRGNRGSAIPHRNRYTCACVATTYARAVRSRSVDNGKSPCPGATSLTRESRRASMPSAAHQTSAFDFYIRTGGRSPGHRLFPRFKERYGCCALSRKEFPGTRPRKRHARRSVPRGPGSILNGDSW
ncbi:hypothetical protein PUN28_008563 [Cardiocondyla obscurior]|uniref:Uncharacterized protein n=1 Tax=Cardiocondyla obscurior TaxID=286306 RepID=A0AAW2G125_9HYME